MWTPSEMSRDTTHLGEITSRMMMFEVWNRQIGSNIITVEESAVRYSNNLTYLWVGIQFLTMIIASYPQIIAPINH